MGDLFIHFELGLQTNFNFELLDSNLLHSLGSMTCFYLSGSGITISCAMHNLWGAGDRARMFCMLGKHCLLRLSPNARVPIARILLLKLTSGSSWREFTVSLECAEYRGVDIS